MAVLTPEVIINNIILVNGLHPVSIPSPELFIKKHCSPKANPPPVPEDIRRRLTVEGLALYQIYNSYEVNFKYPTKTDVVTQAAYRGKQFFEIKSHID